MTFSSSAHIASHRARQGGATACALGALALATALGLFTPSASAQWIGTPGGSGEVSAPAAVPAPSATESAPASAPAAASAPASAAPASSGFSSPGMIGAPGGFSGDMGMSSPGMSAPGLSAPGMIGTPGMSAGPDQAAMQECQTQVNKLRGDVEARGNTLRKASEKKVPPTELCPLFRNFVSSQQKFIGYLNTNKSKCQVPDEALAELRKNASAVSGVRDKVCQIAAAGGAVGPAGPPPQGSISAGLGLPSGLPSGSAPPGGVFDTLVGDALR